MITINSSSTFEQYPLFDLSEALKNTGNETLLAEMLTLMKEKLVPEDLASIKLAFGAKDWDKVKQYAHKLKSGAIYVGTIRLKMVCQYLEDHGKTEEADLLNKLYQQTVTIVKDTMSQVDIWLTKHKNVL